MASKYCICYVISFLRWIDSAGPNRVYNTTKLHKQTKNQWARDDPAFVVVLLAMVAVATLAYAIAFRISSAWQLVRLLLSAMLIDFIGLGVVRENTPAYCDKAAVTRTVAKSPGAELFPFPRA